MKRSVIAQRNLAKPLANEVRRQTIKLIDKRRDTVRFLSILRDILTHANATVAQW